MLSSRTILGFIGRRRHVRQLMTKVTDHHEQPEFKKITSMFDENPHLSFQSQSQFQLSELYERLRSLFDAHYALNVEHRKKLKTISMAETLEILGLTSTYQGVISDHKYLVGIHGASISSIPRLIPNINGIQSMQTYHNPYHANAAQLYFFYGSNVSMSLHYSELNSINTEKIDGASDPQYYPARIGVLGFVDRYIIDLINNEDEEKKICQDDKIIAARTITWKKQKNGLPDEHHIGNEIRLPRVYHEQVFNLLTFKIRGNQRLFPLDQGMQYHDGKPCKWVAGQGFVDHEDVSLRM